MNTKSFTLIEVLVALVILGILSTFIIISLNNVVDSANDAKRKKDLDSVSKMLMTYGVLNGSYPTDDCNIGEEGCLEELSEYTSSFPKDPSGDSYHYFSSNGSTYTITATLSTGQALSYNPESGFNQEEDIELATIFLSNDESVYSQTIDTNHYLCDGYSKNTSTSTYYSFPDSLQLYSKSSCSTVPYCGCGLRIHNYINLSPGNYQLIFYKKTQSRLWAQCSSHTNTTSIFLNDEQIWTHGINRPGCSWEYFDWEEFSIDFTIYSEGSYKFSFMNFNSDCAEGYLWLDNITIQQIS